MNRQSFDISSPNGRKHFQKLLDTLLDYNSDENEEYYNDIHIYQEESLIIIEWDNIPYSHEWGGKWCYIQEDEVVMKAVAFPDNHYEYMFSDEIDDRLKKWHEENPEWIKTFYGTWTNETENLMFYLDSHLTEFLQESEKVKKVVEDTSKTSLKHILDTYLDEELYETSFIIVGSRTIDDTVTNESLDINIKDISKNSTFVRVGTLNFKDKNIVVYFDKDCKNNILLLNHSYNLITKLILESEK